MNYLLDSNIALMYLRNAEITTQIDALYSPFSEQNMALLSVVNLAELYSIAFRHQWGTKKWQGLRLFQEQVFVTDIHVQTIIERYAEIDAFSQGKHPTLTSAFSARNMGKNDLWIGATASVLGATLLTMDKDFDHLNGVFLTVERI
jgi:tRNA(fMet)-specific endonuclease VapC